MPLLTPTIPLQSCVEALPPYVHKEAERQQCRYGVKLLPGGICAKRNEIALLFSRAAIQPKETVGIFPAVLLSVH